MASRSLHLCRTDRSASLDRLVTVHTKVTGGLRGRPRDTTELNHALFLRLAGEVQGFCPDLHDEAIEAVCTPSQIPNQQLRDTMRASLARGRKLDSGNAGPGNIGNDWTHLGIVIWTELKSAYPAASVDWRERLEWLNDARNGIAHNDATKIAKAHQGHPLTLRTFRVMRKRLDRFAVALDRTTGAYLQSVTAIAPW